MFLGTSNRYPAIKHLYPMFDETQHKLWVGDYGS